MKWRPGFSTATLFTHFPLLSEETAPTAGEVWLKAQHADCSKAAFMRKQLRRLNKN